MFEHFLKSFVVNTLASNHCFAGSEKSQWMECFKQLEANFEDAKKRKKESETPHKVTICIQILLGRGLLCGTPGWRKDGR